MTTSNPGRRRLTSDPTDMPADPLQHDADVPNRRTHSDPIKGASPSRHAVISRPRSLLIGRNHEVAAIQHLLLQEQVGLLTLTGPGGIGKTRLALQVAANLLDHFVDGVYNCAYCDDDALSRIDVLDGCRLVLG